jgi:multicomponent Na+:H+ antiporter subunit C
MSTTVFYMLGGAALFLLGLYGVVRQAHLVRKLLAINIMGNGVFVILIATAHRNSLEFPDPVPQAMVLTGIVVAVCATAFGLALVERLVRETGQAVLPRAGRDDD